MARHDVFSKMKRVLATVMFLNFGVALAKILLGALTNSAAILADGFHSFSDGSSNIVGLVGLRFASKPKDKDHPYGHKKLENFTAIGIAMMLFLVCFEVFEKSLDRLFNPVTPEVNPWTFVVLGLTTIINYAVMTYEYAHGKRLKSDILVADAYHTKSDVYISLSVMVSLIGVGLGFPLLDAIVSMIIVVFIGHVAFDVLRSTSRVLCDAAIIDAEKIRKVVMAIKGVKGCHEIRTRGREDDIMVDLHITVSRTMGVTEAHEITKEIEAIVKGEFSGVSEVIVHIEPAVRGDGH